MLSKILTSVTLVLALSLQVHAHAAVAPVLGVNGNPVRGDVERPSNANPCGETNIAANIDSSTPIVAAADGTFTATVTNFNGHVFLLTQKYFTLPLSTVVEMVHARSQQLSTPLELVPTS